MKELYINGRLVDLDATKPIALTFAVNNLAELRDRQANFSNIFKCPPTENNREIFGFADSDSWTQDEPYTILTAKLVQNGIEIVPNGIAIIKEAGADFEVQVLSGVKGFITILGDKTLQDLNLSEFDHTWDLATAISSQSNLYGFKYPVIDYGAIEEEQDTIDPRLLRPATFNHTIIKQIAKDAGYTIEGEALDDPLFNRELIPFSLDKFVHSADYLANVLGAKNLIANGTNLVTYTAVEGYFPGSPDSFGLDGNIIYNSNEIGEPGLFNGALYISNVSSKVSISIEFPQITISKVGSVGPGQCTIGLQKNGATIPDKFIYIQGYGTSSDKNISWEGEIGPGDELRVRFTMVGIQMILSPGYKLTIKHSQDVIYGSEIQLAATLPKISQKDYLKDFMQRYCLTPVVDNYKNKITFKSFAELYQNKGQARDWTDKFTAKKEQATFTLGNYAQVNYGKYKEDDNVDEGLGIGSFAVANQTLKNENDVFTSVFSASEAVERLNGFTITQIKKIADPAKSLDFSIKTQARILLDNVVEDTGLTMVDGSETGLTDFFSMPLFAGLEYSVLFPKYYYELINYMLNKARKVTREVLIDESDIAELDHFIPVYDANEAKYYYVNQIADYMEGEPTKCEFIRM